MIDYDSRRWLSVIFRWRGSVLATSFVRIATVAALGALAVWLYRDRGFHAPPIAHTILGVALGLLLVFRTNASYDRWWEGRRMFGMIVNRSRDLARQICTFVDDREERALLVRWVRVTYALICQHLRRERELGALGDLVTAEERASLEPASCRPAIALAWISARLAARARAGAMSEQRLQLVDGNLTSFFDSFGAAERIMKTPVPFAYAQHIKMFLALFCFTVPFAIVDVMGWATPAVCAGVAFAMFGIEEIAVEIEDPFGYDANDLPLDRIGATIDADLHALLGDADRAAAA